MPATADPVAPARVDWWPEERKAFEPPLGMLPSEFAERHVYLPDEITAQGGFLSFDLTPYLREIVDSAADPACRQVVACTSTQVGKTTALFVIKLWRVACDPCWSLWLGPAEDDVTHIFFDRLRPIVNASAHIKSLLGKSPRDYKRVLIRFGNGAVIHAANAQAGRTLRGKPIKEVVADEVDAMPDVVNRKENSHPVDLCEERLRTFEEDAFLIMASTPTLESGQTWVRHQQGDKRRYWVPCPRCGSWQTFDPDRMEIDGQMVDLDRIESGDQRLGPERTADDLLRARAVRYLCRHCDAPIQNSEKRAMMSRGKWVQARARIDVETGKVTGAHHATSRSYQLSALYSPWLTWEKIAEKILWAAADARERMQRLFNLWWGLPYRDKVMTPTEKQVKTRRVDYKLGEVPPGLRAVVAGVDVQHYGFYWVIRGWGENGRSWLLDRGLAPDWKTLARMLFARAFESEQVDKETGEVTSKRLVVECVCIDSAGGREDEVYDFVRKSPLVHATKGRRKMPVPYRTTKLKTSRVPGAKGLPIQFWSNDHYFRRLARSHHGDLRDRGAWMLPSDIDDDYVRQLTSQRLERVRAQGEAYQELWRKLHENHYWDCEALCLLASDIVGVHAFETDGGITGGESAPPPAPASKPPPRSRSDEGDWSPMGGRRTPRSVRVAEQNRRRGGRRSGRVRRG